MTEHTDIAILGAGPAGAAVAIALARLGHAVRVIGVPRAFDACEGVSERVLAALASAGLREACASAGEASARVVCWNGERRAANSERLLSRREFDAALLRDLRSASIGHMPVRARSIQREADGRVRISLGDSDLLARLLIDARGRVAPRAGLQRLRGPETVSLLQRWQGPVARTASSVLGFEDGWAWLACCADGTRYTQLTLAADELPKRAQLAGWLHARFADHPDIAAWVEECRPLGVPVARSSTAILQTPLIANGVLRVGDAAMAVDPLSGNGIFQALSSASVAPAVVNTLLRDPDSAALATAFYAQRVEHIFMRFARMGRDFHRLETRWQEAPFWQARSQWPDAEPAHDRIAPRLLGVEPRAVVDNGFVREREVVVSTDQPLGVWRVADIEVAPLLRELPRSGARRVAALEQRIQQASAGNEQRARAVAAWCARLGLLPELQKP